jgi:hypothetical protein
VRTCTLSSAKQGEGKRRTFRRIPVAYSTSTGMRFHRLSCLKKLSGLLTLGIAMVISLQFILLSALDVFSSVGDHQSSLRLKRFIPLQTTTRIHGTLKNATRLKAASASASAAANNFNSLQANTSLESASACLLVCDDNHFLIGAFVGEPKRDRFTLSTVHRFRFSECL